MIKDEHGILAPTLLEQPRLFDDLVQETHELLQKKNDVAGQYIYTIIKIGQNLNEMRWGVHGNGHQRTSPSQFIQWVTDEFHLKRTTAQDYMRIAIIYGANIRRAEHLPQRVLSILAAPSTTEDVRKLVEAGHISATPEAIRAANKACRAVIESEQWTPEAPTVEGAIESSTVAEGETLSGLGHYEIHCCSIADLHNHVVADSLDAIVTDPPYPREFLPVYNNLADFAIHALKPGGSLIVMVGQSYLPDILDMLRKEPLKYFWLSCYYTPGETTKIWPRHIGASWKPLLWFVKGKYTGPWVKDVIKAEDIFIGRQKDKKHHEWGQPVEDMANILTYFTQPGQLICDPFVGGGSTAVAAVIHGRFFIGGDSNEACVQKTKQRIKDAFSMQNGHLSKV